MEDAMKNTFFYGAPQFARKPNCLEKFLIFLQKWPRFDMQQKDVIVWTRNDSQKVTIFFLLTIGYPTTNKRGTLTIFFFANQGVPNEILINATPYGFKQLPA